MCTKPDYLGRGSSAARSGTRNPLCNVFFPRSSQASHAHAEDVWPWLHRTWVPSTGGTWCQINPGFSGPLLWFYLQPTLHKAQPSQHLLLSGHLGQHRSPASQFSRTCTGPKLSPPQSFTGETNKTVFAYVLEGLHSMSNGFS